ncbi:MAG: response regulator transcription factor [Azospirillaceae bacterium]|nr:response regulator transcription factor [Azospirillaceae bacterium]
MRVLIASDHRLLREGICQFLPRLSSRVDIVEVDDFEGALSKSSSESTFELSLLSYTLPGMDNTSGIVNFVEKFPLTKVVLLTSIADSTHMLEAISAGAKGVIFKTISVNGMLAALHVVMEGQIYLPAEILLSLAEGVGIKRKPKTVFPGSTVSERFSSAERHVISLLLTGLPNKLMATQLDIPESAVKSRLRRIFKKVNATNRAQAVVALLAEEEREIV